MYCISVMLPDIMCFLSILPRLSCLSVMLTYFINPDLAMN